MLRIGDIMLVANDHKFGPGPDWVAAIVVDVHTSLGGSLREEDHSIFLCTAFHPQQTHARPYIQMKGEDEGETWKHRDEGDATNGSGGTEEESG